MPSIVEVIAKFINEASPGLKQLGGDVDNVGKKSDQTSKSTGGMGDSLKKLAGELGLTVSVAGLAGGAIALLKSSVDAYGESELVAAQVNAVLQSTGGIAGVTAQEVDRLADSLSQMSGVDDEAIKRGEALMLTFTKVGKDVFPAATEAALNMSMAMGTDLQGAIMQVGKALNEPIQGAAALRRVGVQLTDAQEEQIKAFMAVNDVASAQAIILGELNTEFGGVAKMMGDTTVGATNKLKVAWGNLMETMGEGSAGVWRDTVETMTDVVTNTEKTISASNSYNSAIERGSQLMEIYGNDTDSLNYKMNVMGERVALAGYEFQRAEQYGLSWERMLQSQTETTYAASDALGDYVPNFSSLLDLTTSLADETDKYNEKQAEIAQKQADIKTQIDELIAMGYSPLSQKVQDLQQDYDNLGQKSVELSTKHSEAMARMQYDLLLTKLSADGLTDAEYKIAHQAGLTFGVFDAKSIEAARNMDLVVEAVNRGKLKVEDMKRAIDLLPKLKNIDLVINAIANISTNYQAQQQNAADRDKNRVAGHTYSGYAEGGIATGPTSGHWELLHGTEAVIPLQGGSVPVQINGAGGGGNVSVTVQINSPINLMSETEAQNVLVPLVVNAVKQAEAEARL
jgi:hypothetical protein